MPHMNISPGAAVARKEYAQETTGKVRIPGERCAKAARWIGQIVL
jgi:hypothetical protein